MHWLDDSPDASPHDFLKPLVFPYEDHYFVEKEMDVDKEKMTGIVQTYYIPHVNYIYWMCF